MTESVFNQRSVWWLITAFGDNIQKVEDVKCWPRLVKKVWGGREQCPKSGRDHFQGAVECHGQQRASFFRDWLPGVHFQKARSSEAVKKYSLKADTAIGTKGVIENPEKYMTMDRGMMLLAEVSLDKDTDPINEEYWELVNLVIRKQPGLISMYASPAFRTAWNQTRRTWRALVLQARSFEGSETDEKEIECLITNEDGKAMAQESTSGESQMEGSEADGKSTCSGE